MEELTKLCEKLQQLGLLCEKAFPHNTPGQSAQISPALGLEAVVAGLEMVVVLQEVLVVPVVDFPEHCSVLNQADSSYS